MLGAAEADLAAPLAAIESLQRDGLGLNLVAALVPAGDPGFALDAHRRRIGSLLCGVDAGLTCDLGGPALPRRLPGRVRIESPVQLDPAPLGPLELAQLAERLPGLGEEKLRARFSAPLWEQAAGGWEAALWPGVPLPEGARLLRPPLLLPTATPVAEALRAALRADTGRPVPFLPLDQDPTRLHAIQRLTPELGAFQGSLRAWEGAFRRLSALPAPPHFCARC